MPQQRGPDILYVLRRDALSDLWHIAEDLEDAADEIERLRQWKAEATEVLAEWEQVWEAAGRPGPLGTSKATAVRRALEGTCDEHQ